MKAVWWGAIGGVLAALAATIAQMTGNLMPGSPLAFGMAGLFWGYVAGHVRR